MAAWNVSDISDPGATSRAFGNCLVAAHRPLNESNGVEIKVASAATGIGRQGAGGVTAGSTVALVATLLAIYFHS